MRIHVAISSVSSRALRGALLLASFAALPAVSAAQTLTPPDTAQGCEWAPECSASGVTLRMAELSRSGKGRGTKVAVSPRVSGFPAGVPFTLWMRRTGGDAQWIATGYALDSVGAASCADRARHAALAATAGTGWCPAPLEQISLDVGDAMQGESFAFAASTEDGRLSAYAVVVPRPVTVATPGCGSLDARVVDAEAKAIAITGRDFAPSARITTESRSGKDVVAGEVNSDSTGRFVAIVMPGTAGGRGGEAAFVARSGSCEVTLSYPWGRAAR
jgi:hypothetical protein